VLCPEERWSRTSPSEILLTSCEGGDVVVGVVDGDGDGGGGGAAGGHASHVLSLDHQHILAPGFPVQSVGLAADHTCRETVIVAVSSDSLLVTIIKSPASRRLMRGGPTYL